MPFIFFIIFTVVAYSILYFVIKAAVRGGIIEARHVESLQNDDIVEGNNISQTICPNCGKKHDIDYPKCPFCKHKY